VHICAYVNAFLAKKRAYICAYFRHFSVHIIRALFIRLIQLWNRLQVGSKNISQLSRGGGFARQLLVQTCKKIKKAKSFQTK
jgi:hypothetical protein